VPCDNTPGNGALAERVVHDLAELVDTDLAAWLKESVAVVTTMVDRITPRTAAEDVRTVLEATGLDDRRPVVSEPFHEWVLSGAFPGGRPRWEDAGATFTDNITPHEHRKLWLLNGAHSLLAYAGSIRGHTTVAEAVGDGTCRSWVEEWWVVASPHLDQPSAELAAYRAALLERFANARMHDRLDRIAADGSQKLPIRILPVLRAERSAGRLPLGATRVLAAWVCHLRGLGAPVSDVRADEVVPLAEGPLREVVPRVLGRLDAQLGADAGVVAAVVDQSEQLSHPSSR
jgi:fructuronate reductase